MEAAFRPHFGALLRQFRLDAGMTQQELAERAKLSVQAVSALERGARTRPYRETVVLLGRALSLSPEREALLRRAIGIPSPSRQRESAEVVNASLLSLVRPDAQMTPKHNLSAQLTSFVGRQRDLREIAAFMQQDRLVTVVGAGGVGKTRVAVHTASALLGGNPDGVWLIDLAPLADQTLVASAVLSAMRLPSTTGSALDAVIAYLKTRRLLLILDNCEHVIPCASEVATSIGQACPHVRVLATSREALGVPGERIYRLPSLSVPATSCRTAQEALRYGAIVLFVDRAFAVNSDFVLTDDNVPNVAEICRHLDGIPLAIELAAARVNVLAPRQIAQHLDQRFRLLTGGDPRALPRHRTMTALIDWSYDLLSPRERRFFESLSVFAGGCTLEAARSVCATDGEDDVAVIDLVTSLVTKSLLVAELVGSEQRYRLLESSRHYARDKLIARGKHSELAWRHALFYVEFAERLERVWDTTRDRAWLPQVNAELENLRTVLEWTLAKRLDVILGQRLAALRNVVWRSFPLPDARRWVQSAIELIDEFTPSALMARLEHAAAEGAAKFGEHKVSLAAAQRAATRYRELGDALGTAQAQAFAGRSLAILGKTVEAEQLLHEALATAHALQNRRLAASILHTIGTTRSLSGDFAGARTRLTDAFGLAKALGAEFLAASITADLSSNEYDAGDSEAALRLMVDVLAAHRTLDFSGEPGIVSALASIAMYLVALGRYDEARARANDV